jgi:hypothetical protein
MAGSGGPGVALACLAIATLALPALVAWGDACGRLLEACGDAPSRPARAAHGQGGPSPGHQPRPVAHCAGPAPTVCRGRGWRRDGGTGRCGDHDPGGPLRAPGRRRLWAGGLRQHAAAIQRNRQPAQQPADSHRPAGWAPIPPATGSIGRRAARPATSAAAPGARAPNPPNPASPSDPAKPVASGQAHSHHLQLGARVTFRTGRLEGAGPKRPPAPGLPARRRPAGAMGQERAGPRRWLVRTASPGVRLRLITAPVRCVARA